MNRKNQFGALLGVLLLAWLGCMVIYWLPDEIVGLPVKRVDMLSDLWEEPKAATPVASYSAVAMPDTAEVIAEPAAGDRDSAAVVRRDSVYHAALSAAGAEADGVRIEDFTAGHTALQRFFSSLSRVDELGRPVRIAFLGDSFVEGDILLADLRAKLQAKFGGRGVGFVPVASVVEQYRPTVYQRSKGWKTYSLLSHRQHRYVLSGMLFEAEGGEATVTFKMVNTYPGLEEVSSVKFLYSRNDSAELRLTGNGARDTFTATLPATESVRQYEVHATFRDGTFRFRHAKGLQALGVALEDERGVVVDNFSLRSNSGVPLGGLDEGSCRELGKVRPYDLIVLQYGLNVATEDVRQYGWYRDRMVQVIQHLRVCFPETDILMLSVSDRSYYSDGAYRTMPAVVSLRNAQRETALRTHIAFWDTFRAMGGENGMVRYVKQHWASKDHTHLSFRGGRELAVALFNALMIEKDVYAEMDRVEE
ncbi:MAG: hypothetical protein LBR49_01005 [Tannerella sp.]|jgi:hypothetical protein|nr:hypothetical protein [Tannerella sp.]